MLQRRHLMPRKYFLQYMRRFSDDPTKTFREKGLAEENRYFLKKQTDEIKKLRKQFEMLAKYQEKLEDKLNEAEKIVENLGKNAEKREK